jgi:hypothetical protein
MTSHCGYCGKGPFLTEGGLNKHIGQSKNCQEKNRLSFKSYTSTLWTNTPDARNPNLPSSPSPSPDETLDNFEHDLLAVEQNFGLDMTGMTDTRLPLPEEETLESRHYVEEYPSEQKAGGAWGKDQPFFVRIHREQQENGTSKWGPFKDRDEWELAEWLMKNVGQKQTDAFLKLNVVSFYTSVVMQQMSV